MLIENTGESIQTIYGLALGHVAIIGVGEKAIAISSNNALDVAAALSASAKFWNGERDGTLSYPLLTLKSKPSIMALRSLLEM